MRLPVDLGLGGVANYTVCAPDGGLIGVSQFNDALYTAAVQHRYLSEVEGAIQVVDAANARILGQGGVRAVEGFKAWDPFFYNPLYSYAFQKVSGHDFGAAREQVANRLFTTPDDPRQHQPNALLQAIADAAVAVGDYRQWDETRQFLEVTKTTVTLVALTAAAYASGGTLTPLLVLQITDLAADVALKAVEHFVKTPHDYTLAETSQLLATATDSEPIRQWTSASERLADGKTVLTHESAEKYMQWRSSVIANSRAAETLYELSGNWDTWVALGEIAATPVGMAHVSELAQLVDTGANAAASLIALGDAMGETFQPYNDLKNRVKEQNIRNESEHQEFLAELGISGQSLTEFCPTIPLGLLNNRLQFSRSIGFGIWARLFDACKLRDFNDPARPGSLRYVQSFTFIVHNEQPVEIALESRSDMSLSLLHFWDDGVSPDELSVDERGEGRIARTLRRGRYEINVGADRPINESAYTITVTGDTSTGRTLTAAPTVRSTGQVRLSPWKGYRAQYQDGESVRIAADPVSGYQFVRWQGSATGSANPMEIRMDADKDVRAVFARIARHDDGVCSEGMTIAPDHYCTYPGANRVFSVAPSAGAQSPWSPELNRTAIKVDPYVDTVAHTFQAQELSDGSWWIEVMGAWSDLGVCRQGLTVEPGQYCTRAGTTEQFRVYAVDELIASDSRERFADGYAVLYSEPVAIDDEEVPVGDIVAHGGAAHVWTLGDPEGEDETGDDATPAPPDEQDDSIESDNVQYGYGGLYIDTSLQCSNGMGRVEASLVYISASEDGVFTEFGNGKFKVLPLAHYGFSLEDIQSDQDALNVAKQIASSHYEVVVGESRNCDEQDDSIESDNVQYGYGGLYIDTSLQCSNGMGRVEASLVYISASEDGVFTEFGNGKFKVLPLAHYGFSLEDIQSDQDALNVAKQIASSHYEVVVGESRNCDEQDLVDNRTGETIPAIESGDVAQGGRQGESADDDGTMTALLPDGRIVARLLAEGRIEFGFRPDGEGTILPASRFFPANAPVGRWLSSSHVEVDGNVLGRITAQLLADGRVEFGFLHEDGERILPATRFFPADARVDRWLRSSLIELE